MVPNLTTVIQTFAVAIGVLSLVLSYISHRGSVFDSRYERESKIDDKLNKLPLTRGELSTADHQIDADYIKSTVYKEQPYCGWGFLFPLAEMQGRTKLSFSITDSPELSPGKYVSEIDNTSTLLTAVGVNVEPDTGGIMHVMIDSVNVDEIGRSMGAIETEDYSLERDKEKYDRLFDSRTDI